MPLRTGILETGVPGVLLTGLEILESASGGMLLTGVLIRLRADNLAIGVSPVAGAFLEIEAGGCRRQRCPRAVRADEIYAPALIKPRVCCCSHCQC